MSPTISITAIASVSPLGNELETIWNNYQNLNPCFQSRFLDQKETWVGPLDEDSKAQVAALRQSDIKYKSLDNSVLYAMLASRKAIAKAGWSKNDVFGINIGSSRGATDLFEQHFQEYITLMDDFPRAQQFPRCNDQLGMRMRLTHCRKGLEYITFLPTMRGTRQ